MSKCIVSPTRKLLISLCKNQTKYPDCHFWRRNFNNSDRRDIRIIIPIRCSTPFYSLLIPFLRHSNLNYGPARWISKKLYQFPELREEDIEEHFARGSGPGGQAVNKTANCVFLKHKPTGLVVKCHETRSQETNRKRARETLLLKLDDLINGEKSFRSQQIKEICEEKTQKKNKACKNLELKKSFKEREGLE
ncbi:hypothetical protein CHS0354_024628 [Potamilus streckersoni]|uniref:Prokaryotic-type class I peptide chain release factors domain-containing protein n=1 Tax=Potamilus streckersoni TaxID=2493646 RepID=A0AAE0SVM6_9BIVA|nr:hypothetical protein CHS0354_024628 [Potamilus streckersoni]